MSGNIRLVTLSFKSMDLKRGDIIFVISECKTKSFVDRYYIFNFTDMHLFSKSIDGILLEQKTMRVL